MDMCSNWTAPGQRGCRVSKLTSGFVEAQCDVSVEAQTEVVVEDINRKLRSSRDTEVRPEELRGSVLWVGGKAAGKQRP